ncbi:Archaeal/vacuolar-type H+-ATPase subunit I [Methanonatronarchaeum thermophilum]|uniref:A-type ATP synthase subunit I n=1 Tax=Methanonatronarchaeum thermophilum TaxID=1927129 RepID=A0A1Y3GI70_9EURY|nr:V-type ATP synthase subunit I [Methanonatronarchaeum thermophilum]OUJ19135.1 Archaeal/vacuolar-type H+-ATPase subunit I [Methanonatronarchaeum thermophilum]
MFWPKRMEKVEIVTLRNYRDPLIEELQKAGLVHIDEATQSIQDFPDFFTFSDASEEKKNLRSYHLKSRRILDIFDKIEEITTEEESFREKIKNLFSSEEKTQKTIEPKLKVETEDLDFIDETVEQAKRLENQLTELENEKEKIKEHQAQIKQYTRFDIPLSNLGETKYTHTVIGKVPREKGEKLLDKLQTNEKTIWINIKKNEEGKDTLAATFLKEQKEEILETFNEHDVELFTPKEKPEKTPSQIVRETEASIKKIKETKTNIINRITEMDKTHRDKTTKIKKTLEVMLDRKDAQEKMGESTRVSIVEGWIPKEKSRELKEIVGKITNGIALTEIREPTENDDVPVELDNPSYFKGFELLTSTYALPKYNEVDPTAVMALFLPLLFGVMFGDVGHGLIVFLAGLLLLKVAKGAIKDLAVVMLPLGFFAMIFGFIYGKFMGLTPSGQVDMFGFALTPADHALFLYPIDEPITFLVIALTFGIIHMTVGMGLDIFNKLKHSVRATVIPISKIWILLGAAGLVATSILEYGMDPMAWNIPLFLAVLIPPVILLALGELIAEIGHFNGPKEAVTLLGEGAFEAFHGVLSFVSNTISYSRLFALSLVHIGLFLALVEVAEVFTSLAGGGAVGVAIGWILFYSIATLVILALDGIIVFLHSLRLHYYEWFEKFYSGGSRRFIPFKLK